jgi:hypothetical protein
VRSERVSLNPDPAATDNVLRAVLDRIVFRGVDYEATCTVDGEEIRAVVAATSWDHALKEGDEVNVGFATRDAILFPLSEEGDIIKYSMEAV